MPLQAAVLAFARRSIQVFCAIVLGFTLMVPLGLVFDVMGWPTFHSWGLDRGGFFSAWPALFLVSFGLLGLIPWFRGPRDGHLLALAALVGLGLTSVLVVLTPGGSIRVPVHLLIGAFASSAILGYLAHRPWVAGLAIALPILFFDSQYVVMPWSALASYIESTVMSVTVPIVTSALLGTLAAYAPRRGVRG